MDLDVLKQAARDFPTPFFAFDQDALAARTAQMKEIAKGRYQLCYAMKANPFFAKQMSTLVDRVEVCSWGELQICMDEQISPAAILLSGVYKNEPEVSAALEYGVRLFTAESRQQLQLLCKLAEEKHIAVDVLLRLSAGNQFGIDSDEMIGILNTAEKTAYVKITGLHYFAGTQRAKSNLQERDAATLQKFLQRVQAETAASIETIEYGPGLYIPYFRNEKEDSLESFEMLCDLLSPMSDLYTIRIEMGRYFAAPCADYVTRVVDTKLIGETNYAILDGGIHHLNYYGSNMGMRTPVIVCMNREETPEKDWTLCGCLCTTADVIAVDAKLKLQVGDDIVFRRAGAYSMTETPVLFLSHDLPAIISFSNGSAKMLRKPLSTSDLNH